MMRWSWVSLGFVTSAVASGCREQPAPFERPPSAEGELGVSAKRRMDSGALAPPSEPAAPEGEPPARTPTGDACPEGPAWTSITRCSEGGYLYAVGKTSGITSPDLARATAANRARALLAAADPLELTEPRTLERVEILEHAPCDDAMYALARMPLGETAALTPCASGTTALGTSKDGDDARCPAWTRRGVWVEGSELIAVASARAGKPVLAEKVARNRAAGEAVRYGYVTVANRSGTFEVSSAGVNRFVPGESERAECDGFVFVKVRHALPSP